MQIEALKIYCDVVRFHSFSRGAEENDVLQSSASQAVQSIEENLSVSLIDRSRRPWEVTEEGRVFYEGCRELVEGYYALVAQVKNRQAAADSVIRVAAIYSVNFADMGQCVERFKRFHPEAKVEVEYAHPDRVCERVLSDEADLGILSYPAERKGVAVIPWRDEPMVLACRPGHRFAKLKKLDLNELSDETLVGFDTELVIWKKIDRFLKDNGVEPNVAVRFDNIEAIKRAVEAGSGVALLPRPTLEHELALGTLAAVPLADDQLSRPVGIIHRKGRKLNPNMEAFIEVLKTGTCRPSTNGHAPATNSVARRSLRPRRGARTKS